MIKNIRFNKVFEKINNSQKRYRIFKGGAGSGKSFNIAQDFVLKLCDPKYKGANLLVVRKTEESNRDSTFAELRSAIFRIFGDEVQRFWGFNAEPLRIFCKTTGNQIIFRGMKDNAQRERVKSISFSKGKLCWIWVEEASELDVDDVELLDDRLRGELCENLFYQITLSFNPVVYAQWIRKRFFDVVDEETIISHSTFLDNEFIDLQFHERMKKRQKTDPEGFCVYALGEWGKGGGNIFSNYVVENFDQKIENFDSVCLGQDFGFNHANAILLCGFRDGELFLIAEQVDREKVTSEIIRRCCFSKEITMWCDSAEPDRIVEWKKAGFRAKAVVKNNGSVKAQIDWLKARKIHIHKNCVNVFREIQQYRWKKDERTKEFLDEPVNVNDDVIAALRYAIESLRKEESVSFK